MVRMVVLSIVFWMIIICESMAGTHFVVKEGTFLLASSAGCPRVAYLPVGTTLDVGAPVEILDCKTEKGSTYLPVVTSLGFTGFIDPNDAFIRELKQDVIVIVSENGVKGKGRFYYYSDDIDKFAFPDWEEDYRLIGERKAITRTCGHFAIVNDGRVKDGFIRVMGKMCNAGASDITNEAGWFPEEYVNDGKAVIVRKNSSNDYLVAVKRMQSEDVSDNNFIVPLSKMLKNDPPIAEGPDYDKVFALAVKKKITFCPVEYVITKKDKTLTEIRVCKQYMAEEAADGPTFRSLKFCYRHAKDGGQLYKCSTLVKENQNLRFVQNSECTEKLFAYKYKDSSSAKAPYQPYNELQEHLRSNHDTGSGDKQIEGIIRNIILFEASCLESSRRCQSPSKVMDPKDFIEAYF